MYFDVNTTTFSPTISFRQVLLDKGVTVEEIKLYGVKEDDSALPICSPEDSFEELEDVITKVGMLSNDGIISFNCLIVFSLSPV